MTLRPDPRTTGLAAVLLTLATAAALHRLSPPPRAETKRGSEQAFANGLEAREIEDGVLARRWAGSRLVLSFLNLPTGPLDLEVEVRSQKHPVVVSQAGAVLGVLPPGVSVARFPRIEARAGRLDLELTADTFIARGGRPLGFLFERAALSPAPAGLVPPFSLCLWMLLPTAAALAASRALGLSSRATLALVGFVQGVLAALLLPYGLVRSPYSRELGAWLALGVLGSALVGRTLANRGGASAEGGPGAGPWAFVALLSAFVVQGLVPAHPCLVSSDAVFHAHNLQAVANGDFALTSLTPHDPPFQFPYGVSFYFLQVPLLHSGADLTTLVRFTASLSACAAAAALFVWLAPGGAPRAALAVALLQLMPATLDLLSAGNYSNVFAQSTSVLFLAWWAGGLPGGPVVGTLLLAVAAVAHFGGLLFLLALCALLLIFEGRALDRPRALALGAGALLTAAYYFQFLGLMARQVPRALAGTRAGGGGLLQGLATQGVHAAAEWGVPILGLAALGLACRVAFSSPSLPRGLAALGLAGLPFLLAAAASPLEVRYLYAVAPAVALLAADGVGVALGPGRSHLLRRALVALALLAQLGGFLAGAGWVLFDRYRG